MSVHEIPVRTLGELIDRTTPADPDPSTGRRRDSSVYRGDPNAHAPLLTSLDKLGGTNPPHTKVDLEEHVLRNFIRYSRPHLGTETINDWEHLISAQHHGVPTRLLDWTYSPLIAAFFATRPLDDDKTDRVIWRLDWQTVHKKFEFPPLALFADELSKQLGHDEKFTPWQLFNWKDKEKPFACMLEPPSLDDRIVAQAAVFTLCSSKSSSFDKFLEEHGLGSALTKFVISSETVPLIRDQLDLAGIDERRLFPDLDGVAKAIRRYYA